MSESMKSEIREAVRKVLKDGKWPLYQTQDDNGLEESEYVEFVLDVLAKMHRV